MWFLKSAQRKALFRGDIVENKNKEPPISKTDIDHTS